MTRSDDIIAVGPLRARVGHVAAFLYIQEAEQPSCIMPKEPRENANDELWQTYREELRVYDIEMEQWYAGEATSISIDLARTRMFLEGLGRLLTRLSDLHTNHVRLEDAGITFSQENPPVWTEEAIQFEFYEAAKSTFGTEKANIREFFVHMYQLITQTSSGPRWGQFVMIYGLENFLANIQKRFDTPF